MKKICLSSRILAQINNPWDIGNEERGRTIATCVLRAPLGQVWAHDIARDTL